MRFPHLTVPCTVVIVTMIATVKNGTFHFQANNRRDALTAQMYVEKEYHGSKGSLGAPSHQVPV